MYYFTSSAYVLVVYGPSENMAVCVMGYGSVGNTNLAMSNLRSEGIVSSYYECTSDELLVGLQTLQTLLNSLTN